MDSISMETCGDSNSLILPPKTKNRKQKSNYQTISRHDQKLSKSQKRKLKKLEEEKEQQLLLWKSLENLEKYKISDEAYLLLRASENIGQAESMREKRRRVMQFSKAGLVVPESDVVTKRKKVGSTAIQVDAFESSVLEIDDKDATFKPMLIERALKNCSTCSTSSQGPVELTNVSDLGRTELSRSEKEVRIEDHCKIMNLDAENSSYTQSPDSDKKTVAAVGELKAESRVDSYMRRCIGAGPISGPLVAPTVVHVSRPKDVENGRRDLPIIMMEQEIMETINNHISVIICGETGCGKTTQIPQFLYEAGYGSTKCPMKRGIIGVTQPRRVAVLSTAKRVAYELGVHLGKEVGFQVRHDKRIGENCSIKFMTDGILLRELQSDFLLKCYSVIILDEAHERSLNTDILIGMLSRVIRQRQAIYEAQQEKMLCGEEIKPELRIYPLKLILMSATLRVEDFTSGSRIFHEPPPVIEIPTRQFPVTTHFSKKTELTDYIGEAYKMVLKIHKKLPSGGILVFVTGQKEVEDLCRKLRQASKQFENSNCDVITQTETSTMIGMGQIDGYNMKEIDEALDTHAGSTESYYDECCVESDNNDTCSSFSGSDNKVDVGSDYEDLEVYDDAVDFNEDVNLDSLKAAFEALTEKTAPASDYKEIDSASQDVQPFNSPKNKGEKKGSIVGPLHILPLYAMLPAAAQLRVFEDIKEGERLVVVATNVAETSLTIPGIRYVVDTGREKVKEYNPSNGMESYEIKWISKASASQRAGRAGRTGPGHCYCLYSSAALSNEFQDFSCPEILKIPVDGVVLVLKSMGISKVANFPFPTPPDATALLKAERCLVALEALDSEGRLTPLGKTMAQYPMSPRHSRLLLVAIQITKKEMDIRQNLVLGYAVAVAAALSSSNPFIFQFDIQTNSEDTAQEDKSGSQKIKEQQAKLMKKEMKKSTKLSRRKFSNLKSDALTVAYALQGFEQSKDPSQFCNENALHLKTMVEMSKLRKQLLQLVFNQRYCGLQEEFSWTHGTIKDVEDIWRVYSNENCLWEKEEDILCQAICAGWSDRVAKRIKGFSVSSEGDRKVNAIRYQSSLVDETVFLRRWSPVSRAAPEFLVYNEMLCTKRPYIQGATSVKSEWLVKHAGSLCTYSSPLTDPMPCYDPHLDQVFCYVIPYYGPHSWELPRSKVPIKDAEQRVTVFAYALLDGQVLPCLKSAKEFMAALPSNILKSEALGQKRVGNFISKLRNKSRTIDCCAMLKEAWKEDPQLLYSEILNWFQDKYHAQFEKLWEKMHQEALLLPQDRFPKKVRKRR
ncbi:ATP-dependent RNA helicase DEAH13 [Bienertia sinuspersici]